MTESSYHGNPNLKSIGYQHQFSPEEIQEIIRCQNDPVYFIENYSGLHSAATNIFMQDMTDGKVSSIFAKRGYISIKPDGERVLVLEDGKRYIGEPDFGELHRLIAPTGSLQ